MKIKEPMEETEEEKTIKLLVDDIYVFLFKSHNIIVLKNF